jgi:hypothetical protein
MREIMKKRWAREEQLEAEVVKMRGETGISTAQ